MERHKDYYLRRNDLIRKLFRLMTTETKAEFTPGEALNELAFFANREKSTIANIIYGKEGVENGRK